MWLPFFKKRETVKYPRRGHLGDAGSDIILDQDVTIVPGKNVIDLGFSCPPPMGCACFITLRSSWMAEGLISNFVPIDSNYSGTYHYLIYNTTDKTIHIKAGERLCQLVFLSVLYPEFIDPEEYYSNIRKEGGIGSTGK